MLELAGQSIGRYHIIEHLGEGGMAVVYRAYDTHLDCDVAIKFIRTDMLMVGELEVALKRFQIEARKTARLIHPNIVRVMDYGEHNGKPYLVMVYLPGGTLKKILGHPVPVIESARLLAPIARALEYAHQQSVIHRDVKPANILLTDAGQPMLSDFGVAKVLVSEGERSGHLTGTGIGIGTPEYMAPEQVMGVPIDHRVDIYALGVVLFELVTGRRPFIADTPMAVAIKHITDPLPRPKDIIPDLPDEVERVLFKALAKKPEDRYQNAGDLASVLERLHIHNLPFSESLPIIETQITKESPSSGSIIPEAQLSFTSIPPEEIIQPTPEVSRQPETLERIEEKPEIIDSQGKLLEETPSAEISALEMGSTEKERIPSTEKSLGSEKPFEDIEAAPAQVVQQPHRKISRAFTWYVLSGVLVMLLIAGGLYYRNRIGSQKSLAPAPAVVARATSTTESRKPTLAPKPSLTTLPSYTPKHIDTPTPFFTRGPTAIPTPNYVTGKVLFEDDFEKGPRSSWDSITGGIWTIVTDTPNNHVLRGVSTGLDYHIHIFLRPVGSRDWQNYGLSYRVKLVSSQTSLAEVSFRARVSEKGCNRYVIGFSPSFSDLGIHSDHYGIGTSCDYDPTQEHVRISMQIGQWYDFRIEAWENRYRVYFQNKPVVFAMDNRSDYMKNGTVIFGFSPNSIGFFDDIRVVELVPR